MLPDIQIKQTLDILPGLSGVPLPLLSAIAAFTPVGTFSAAPVLILPPSLTLDLLAGL